MSGWEEFKAAFRAATDPGFFGFAFGLVAAGAIIVGMAGSVLMLIQIAWLWLVS